MAGVAIGFSAAVNEIGKATYDALMGGGRMDKFIKADEKVRELVNQLFPG